jgi:MYND finger
MIWPVRREKLLDVARWLVSIGVPVDGKDLSGTTALSHSISTKPAFDPEFAEMLIHANGDINARNRYGATCAHEICMVWSPDPNAVERASKALQFFLSHGGDPNIRENDGITAFAAMQAPWLSGMKQLALEEEAHRRKEGCAFCGSTMDDRNAVQLMRCGRCKRVRYCAPPKGCQRAHWTTHKQGMSESTARTRFQ